MTMHHGDDAMIDFPVSDDWLAYYHAKGLTCRAPTPAPRLLNAEADRLRGQIDSLQQEVARLRKEISDSRLVLRRLMDREVPKEAHEVPMA